MQERIRQLQLEHARLAAEGTPLLAEMERKREIEAELESLGAEPDRQLAAESPEKVSPQAHSS